MNAQQGSAVSILTHKVQQTGTNRLGMGLSGGWGQRQNAISTQGPWVVAPCIVRRYSDDWGGNESYEIQGIE